MSITTLKQASEERDSCLSGAKLDDLCYRLLMLQRASGFIQSIVTRHGTQELDCPPKPEEIQSLFQLIENEAERARQELEDFRSNPAVRRAMGWAPLERDG